MKEIFNYLALSFISLFTVINPLGILPIFLASTEGMEKHLVRRLAFRSSFFTLVSLVLFATTGEFIFNFFSISLNGLKIVGGVLFFIVGYDMLQGKTARTKILSENEKNQTIELDVVSITPLAIPLLCGPGAITVITVLNKEADILTQKLLLLLSTVLVCLSCFLILDYGENILRFIGRSGNKVLLRLMGLVMAMMAVEFLFAGLKPYVQNLLTP